MGLSFGRLKRERAAIFDRNEVWTAFFIVVFFFWLVFVCAFVVRIVGNVEDLCRFCDGK